MADLNEIALHACYKVGRTDDFALQMAQVFVSARHRQVYEAFDWKSAQVTGSFTMVVPRKSVEVPNIDHIISVRWRDDFLEPVSTQFIFDTVPSFLSTTGEPKFYTETYNQESGHRSIRFYPAPGPDEIRNGVIIYVLGKKPFDDTTTTLLVPYCLNAMIAFVTADLLEWLHQVGKSQAKLQEAVALLENAKAMDTPPATRPRQGKIITVGGNSLGELTESVCDIIGKWEPEVRVSIQERLRRNYQAIWDAALWPESTVVARLAANENEQIVLPYYFDRVISVRPDTNPSLELQNRDVSYFFNVDPQVFERQADPVSFSMLTSVGVAVLPPFKEKLTFTLKDDAGRQTIDKATIYIKGESDGTEVAEEILIDQSFKPNQDTENPPAPPPGEPVYRTWYAYNTPITIAKPYTRGILEVRGYSSHRRLLTLARFEKERKHLRIWLLPNQHESFRQTFALQTFLVLGKRKMSSLLTEEDTCQLRNVENILINGAAADMLDKMGNTAFAQTLRQKASSSMDALLDAETRQNAHTSIVTPYVEGNYSDYYL